MCILNQTIDGQLKQLIKFDNKTFLIDVKVEETIAEIKRYLLLNLPMSQDDKFEYVEEMFNKINI